MNDVDYAELLRNGVKIYSVVLAQLCIQVTNDKCLANYRDYGLDEWTDADQVLALSYLATATENELQQPDAQKADSRYWLNGEGKFNEDRVRQEEAALVEFVKAAR